MTDDEARSFLANVHGIHHSTIPAVLDVFFMTKPPGNKYKGWIRCRGQVKGKSGRFCHNEIHRDSQVRILDRAGRLGEDVDVETKVRELEAMANDLYCRHHRGKNYGDEAARRVLFREYWITKRATQPQPEDRKLAEEPPATPPRRGMRNTTRRSSALQGGGGLVTMKDAQANTGDDGNPSPRLMEAQTPPSGSGYHPPSDSDSETSSPAFSPGSDRVFSPEEERPTPFTIPSAGSSTGQSSSGPKRSKLRSADPGTPTPSHRRSDSAAARHVGAPCSVDDDEVDDAQESESEVKEVKTIPTFSERLEQARKIPDPAWSGLQFIPYHGDLATNGIKRKSEIFHTIQRDFCPKDHKIGIVYVSQHTDYHRQYKIGETIQNYKQRHGSNSCTLQREMKQLEPNERPPFRGAHRAELLIKHALHDKRLKAHCGDCNCVHGEWFESETKELLLKTVQRWERFVQYAYDEHGRLTTEWRQVVLNILEPDNILASFEKELKLPGENIKHEHTAKGPGPVKSEPQDGEFSLEYFTQKPSPHPPLERSDGSDQDVAKVMAAKNEDSHIVVTGHEQFDIVAETQSGQKPDAGSETTGHIVASLLQASSDPSNARQPSETVDADGRLDTAVAEGSSDDTRTTLPLRQEPAILAEEPQQDALSRRQSEAQVINDTTAATATTETSKRARLRERAHRFWDRVKAAGRETNDAERGSEAADALRGSQKGVLRRAHTDIFRSDGLRSGLRRATTLGLGRQR